MHIHRLRTRDTGRRGKLSADGVPPRRESSIGNSDEGSSARLPRSIREFLSIPNAIDIAFSLTPCANICGRWGRSRPKTSIYDQPLFPQHCSERCSGIIRGIAAAGTAVARTNYDGNWSVLACERDERRRTMRSLHIPRVTTSGHRLAARRWGRNDDRVFVAFSAEITSGMGGGDLAALASPVASDRG